MVDSRLTNDRNAGIRDQLLSLPKWRCTARAPLNSGDEIDASAALDVLLRGRSPNRRSRQFKSLNILRYRFSFGTG